MATCERLSQADAYRDGELSPEDRLGFEAHLAACEECRAELAQLAALSRVVTTAYVPEMPRGLVEHLHENVVIVRERSVLKLAESLIAAAAAVILACGGVIWSGSGGTQVETAGTAAWQSAAVTLNIETVTSETQRVAQWMVDGLSLENGNDQN